MLNKQHWHQRVEALIEEFEIDCIDYANEKGSARSPRRWAKEKMDKSRGKLRRAVKALLTVAS